MRRSGVQVDEAGRDDHPAGVQVRPALAEPDGRSSRCAVPDAGVGAGARAGSVDDDPVLMMMSKSAIAPPRRGDDVLAFVVEAAHSTLMVPVIPNETCAAQKYGNVPTCMKVCSYVVPAPDSGALSHPVSDREQKRPSALPPDPLTTL